MDISFGVESLGWRTTGVRRVRILGKELQLCEILVPGKNVAHRGHLVLSVGHTILRDF